MSYRQPSFMVDNALDAITDVVNDIDEGPNTSAIANSTRRNLIDGRQGSIGFYSATGINSGVDFDLGAAPATELNRLVIPAGHGGFNTKTLTAYHDDSFSFPSATTVSTGVVSGTGVIDRSLSSGTERYWRVLVDDSANLDVFTLGGYWLGTRSTLSADAAVAPNFENGVISEVVETPFPGGIASIELAPPRRRFTLDVRNVDPASADYTVLDAVANAREKAFWYWPPDDIDAGPFLVRLTDDVKREQEFVAPSVSTLYRFRMEFLEDKL